MIIRILGEGQYRVDDASLDALNRCDVEVDRSLQAGDQQALAAALDDLLALVRRGERLADDELVGSELVVPGADASLAEVQVLLDESGSTEGLIPG